VSLDEKLDWLYLRVEELRQGGSAASTNSLDWIRTFGKLLGMVSL
jgi:hypothetical protein